MKNTVIYYKHSHFPKKTAKRNGTLSVGGKCWRPDGTGTAASMFGKGGNKQMATLHSSGRSNGGHQALLSRDETIGLSIYSNFIVKSNVISSAQILPYRIPLLLPLCALHFRAVVERPALTVLPANVGRAARPVPEWWSNNSSSAATTVPGRSHFLQRRWLQHCGGGRLGAGVDQQQQQQQQQHAAWRQLQRGRAFRLGDNDLGEEKTGNQGTRTPALHELLQIYELIIPNHNLTDLLYGINMGGAGGGGKRKSRRPRGLSTLSQASTAAAATTTGNQQDSSSTSKTTTTGSSNSTNSIGTPTTARAETGVDGLATTSTTATTIHSEAAETGSGAGGGDVIKHGELKHLQKEKQRFVGSTELPQLVEL
jgi:hypothetical protein